MSGTSWDPKNDMQTTPSVQPQSSAAGTINGAGVDAVNLSEMGAQLIVGAITGATTVDCTIQESAVVGSGYAGLLNGGGVFTQITASNLSQILNFKRTLRFVRAVVVVGGTNALVAAQIFGQKKVY